MLTSGMAFRPMTFLLQDTLPLNPENIIHMTILHPRLHIP